MTNITIEINNRLAKINKHLEIAYTEMKKLKQGSGTNFAYFDQVDSEAIRNGKKQVRKAISEFRGLAA